MGWRQSRGGNGVPSAQDPHGRQNGVWERLEGGEGGGHVRMCEEQRGRQREQQVQRP